MTRNLRIFALVALVVLMALGAFNSWRREQAARAVEARALAQATARRDALRKECADQRQALIDRAQQSMELEPSSVLRDLERCWNALGDKDLGALRTKATARIHLLVALDKTNSSMARLESLSKLELIDPEEYERQAALVAALRKAADAERAKSAQAQAVADAKAALALAAAKRKEGVSIGMSKQDVLASSWGKPQKVNTTTTAYGTHEQWVYGGGNYLYFKDGVLASIQN